MKLRDLGESGLIRKIRERFGPKAGELPVGIGDDAAVIDLPENYSLVFCSDLLAENTHFIRDLHPPDSIGYKAIAANVSDVAAMGGVATHFLISLAAPGDLDWIWLEAFFRGVEQACERFDIALAGGDSASSEHIFIDVSMIGRVRSGQAVRRSGAKIGDGIYITGTLGSSAVGLERLKSGKMRDAAVERHLFPEPRYQVGAAVANQAHAMIDVSDGLSTDLTHIVEESKVSGRIYKDRLPIWPGAEEHHALHGGEEYELIIIAPELPAIVEGIPVTRIGEIIPSGLEHQLFLIDGTRESVLYPRGWEHFG
ncbi:MAG: thiamine-phosphate kinase [Acidobacteria bacterium]|nr:MAG: thiamine-phosphate kinase [Acidobacteriota bacterium]